MTVFREGKGLGVETASVGPMTEGAAAIAVVVLTILGLASVSPGAMAAIATIVIGIGLMVQGANTAVEYSRVLARSATGSQHVAELGGGVTVEFLAGGVGVVLGILSVLGVNGELLTPVALIVFGGAMLLGGASAARLSSYRFSAAETEPTIQAISHEASAASSGVQILIGLAAVVLGILALVSAETAVLTLVGLLAVGAALLLASATVSGAMLSMFATAHQT